MDAPLEPHEQVVRDELISVLRSALTDDGLQAERTQGRGLSVAAATDLLREPVAARSA